jgi:hypothetical protein
VWPALFFSLFVELFNYTIREYNLDTVLFHGANILYYTTQYKRLYKLISAIRYFYTNMDTKKQKEQVEKLKELEKKNLPDAVKESIKQKIAGLNKPFNK